MTGEKRGADRPPEGPAARGTGAGSGAAFAGLGLQFALAIVVFLYAGQWLDRRFGTNGILTVIGVLFGAGVAIFGVYRRLVADQRRDELRRK